MEGNYHVYAGDKTVGSVAVSREGLYYRFDCRCRLENKEICKICIACGQEQILLGTLIPEGRQYRLCRKLPVKRFTGETLRFFLSGHEEKSEIFIEIRENEPFARLEDLKNAVYRVRNGRTGIVIQKT